MAPRPTVLVQVMACLSVPAILLAAPLHGRLLVEGRDVVALGTFPSWESRTATFTVHNGGEGPLRITKIRHGCGCATATATPLSLVPGESRRLVVKTLPHTLHGPFDKITYVESDDPLRPVTTLRFRGSATPLVSVTPSPVVQAGYVPMHRPLAQSWTLTVHTNGVRFGTARAPDHGQVRCRLAPCPGTEQQWELAVTAPPPPEPGKWQGRVIVPVLEPAGHIPLEFRLSARVGGDMTFVPHHLVLDTNGGDSSVSLRLRIRPRPHGDPHGMRFSWPEIEGVTFTARPPGDGEDINVEARFTAAFLETLARERVMLLRVEADAHTPALLRCVSRP